MVVAHRALKDERSVFARRVSFIRHRDHFKQLPIGAQHLFIAEIGFGNAFDDVEKLRQEAQNDDQRAGGKLSAEHVQRAQAERDARKERIHQRGHPDALRVFQRDHPAPDGKGVVVDLIELFQLKRLDQHGLDKADAAEGVAENLACSGTVGRDARAVALRFVC